MPEVEPLNGLEPLFLQDRHPDGRHVAMQTGWAPGDAGERAGVWDERTGALVWAPRAVSICWLRDGREAAVVTEQYASDFERWSWPERERLGSCEVVHREGWADRVVVSPQDNLAAVRWIDQTEAGFELVEIRADGDRQLKRKGYRTGESNLIEGPVFSPSGRFLALSEGRWAWWRPDDEREEPSPGGRFVAGRVTIFDTRSFEAWHRPVEVEIPPGWLPPNLEQDLDVLGEPRFVSPRAFVVALPTGEERRFGTTRPKSG